MNLPPPFNNNLSIIKENEAVPQQQDNDKKSLNVSGPELATGNPKVRSNLNQVVIVSTTPRIQVMHILLFFLAINYTLLLSNQS